MSCILTFPIVRSTFSVFTCMLCAVLPAEWRFPFSGPLACVMLYLIHFISHFPQTTAICFSHLRTKSLFAFSKSTSCFLNLHISLSAEQHVCLTSRPVPHLFVSVSYLSPLLLTWWLLACPSRLEVQSILQPGLADFVLLCGQNSDPHCTLPTKILQPKHSTHQRAAWLKIDSHSSYIPLSLQ